jgi:hypothetical protein
LLRISTRPAPGSAYSAEWIRVDPDALDDVLRQPLRQRHAVDMNDTMSGVPVDDAGSRSAYRLSDHPAAPPAPCRKPDARQVLVRQATANQAANDVDMRVDGRAA